MKTGILCVLMIFILIMVLSFFRPAGRNSSFWRLIDSLRSSMDLFSYWLITVFAICSFGSVLLVIIWRCVHGGV